MTTLCSSCIQYQYSMEMWIDHLVSSHPLPVKWLSDKAKELTKEENKQPYTVVTDSRKRRSRLTTPRPLNTFMIFSRHIRRNILSVFPDASNSLVSKELGILWKNIPQDVKSSYEKEAKSLLQLHSHEFPNYKYQPKRKCRRFRREIYEHQIFPANVSQASTMTDEESIKQEKDNVSSNDIENQYIRYSILDKKIIKECKIVNSPLKNSELSSIIKKEEYIPNQVTKPFNVRITNYMDSNIILPHAPLLTGSNNIYIISRENVVNNSAVISHSLEYNTEEDIDITGNFFGNELDMEWSELYDSNRQDLPNLNSLFYH